METDNPSRKHWLVSCGIYTRKPDVKSCLEDNNLWGKVVRIVVTTIGTYPSYLLKQIFKNGRTNRDNVHKIFEGMISTSQLKTLG